jgi:PRC-barrel domain
MTMTRTARPIRFLAGSALALALAAPAFAQSSSDQMSSSDQTQQPPAAVEQSGNGTQAPAAGSGSAFDSNAPALKSTMDDKPAATDPLKAADAAADGLPTDPILTTQKVGQTVSDDIIGMDVRNPEDEKIGTIDALVIDKRNRVVAGIVSVGGFLGIGAKDVAVNWKEFTFQPEEKVAMVSLSRQQLENAPEFRDREDVAAQVKTHEPPATAEQPKTD